MPVTDVDASDSRGIHPAHSLNRFDFVVAEVDDVETREIDVTDFLQDSLV